MIRRYKYPVLLVAALLVIALGAFAQRRGGFGGYYGGIEHGDGPAPVFSTNGEFHFIRAEYTDMPGRRRGFGFVSRNGRAGGWWAQDWPDADEHFSQGVQRLTRIDTGEPRTIPFSDDRLFDYPWVYATQTGTWQISSEEAKKLGEYLERGGFLVVDDFWGSYEWDVFQETMERVMPNHPITDIAESDSMMHVLYDIQEKDKTYIPGTRHLRVGPGGTVTVQLQGTTPAWRSISDDKKHMVVAINFNTDVGDAWEYADSPQYPEAMTTLAYRYGVNYLIYSMTH